MAHQAPEALPNVAGQRTHWNTLSIWSLVLGLVQLPIFVLAGLANAWALGIVPLAPGLFAVALGHAAIQQINADPTERSRGKTPAVIGLVLGYLTALLIVTWTVFFVVALLDGALSVTATVAWVLSVVVLVPAAYFTYKALARR